MGTLSETKEVPSIALAWANFDNLIHRNYLSVLDQAVSVSERTVEGFDLHKDCDCVQLDHVLRIVYDKNENNLAKFNSVYSSLITTGQSVFVLIRRKANRVELYIGTRGEDSDSAIAGRSILEAAIRGNFPGVQLDGKSDVIVRKISDDIFRKKCVSVVTGVPDLKEGTEESFSQGIEKIIDAQGENDFSALILATPINQETLNELESGYQRLASQLSLMNATQLSLSKQDTVSVGKSLGESVSQALSDSISLSKSTSTSISKSKTPAQAMAATGAAVGAVVGTAVGPEGTAAGALIGGAVGGAVGSIAGAFFGSTTKTKVEGQAETKTHTVTVTKTGTMTFTETDSQTTGTAVTYSIQERQVTDALAIVDEQLKRIRAAKSYGAWQFAAYFMSDIAESAQTGANVFAGLLRGEQTGVERCVVSNWNSEQRQFKHLIADLCCFTHPRFNLGVDSAGKDIIIEPTSIVNTEELAVAMSFPQKSLPGCPVFEAVEFGRSVTTYDTKKNSRSIEIGNVSHLGAKCSQMVDLDVDSLTSHLFVTGSTGAGKSNFIYGLLNEFHKDDGGDIKFLVIEPAKGEYKDVFGGVSGVSVYGTNPCQTDLLRVNPFAFPDKIHVMEHIDRLIEILNAPWPMYAAMPAILKDAVEQTYKNLGWDLIRSICSHEKPVYPDFHDLLKVLPEVINASAYDQEVKSNYTGSLLTRVKSLTNGYYRMIFQKDELPPADLFDKSCIVDISRVGSTETKSLIMGIVFLKLQEYRMANANPSERNSALRHITVFEEAHNLLRKTNTEQGMESANLAGKSVEMLTNAIAEMRTYGEGFVIADQAPGLLDPAVIRNTNTKVVFRLPDYDDRLLVGKAENLSEEQINELARIPTGCAAVYQNNWQEAVLCQTKKYDEKLSKPLEVRKLDSISVDSRTEADGIRIKVLIARASKKIDFHETLRKLTKGERIKATLYFPDDVFLSNDDFPDGVVLDEVYQTLVKPAVSETLPVKDRRTWTSRVLKRIFDNEAVRLLDDSAKDNLVEVVFRSLSRYDKDPEQAKGWIEQSKCIEDWRVWK